MIGTATPITLTDDERMTLEAWVRKGRPEQRLVQRARMVLEAAAGKGTRAIAALLHVRPATVSKWRIRFARERVAGLQDTPGPERKPRYDRATEQRILAKLDESPPEGFSTWTGRLLAQALGDVSRHQVWRLMRKHGIHLQRRRSGCVSTEPQFAQKAADIVGLYLDPPENAVVVSVDEEPAIQVLERAQGWLRLSNGRALRRHTREYKRHGTATLFAALVVHLGIAHVGDYRRRRRREFLAFMNRVTAQYPDTELHVILDNLDIHRPKHDRWLAHHPNVHFHYMPTHASWLNQVEIWFSILTRSVLRGLSATDPRQLCQAIDRFTSSGDQHPVPFEWTKAVVHPVGPNKALP